MLQAHSFLWHYLWIAPNVLLLFIALFILRRNSFRENSIFLIFAFATAIEQLVVYAADVIPTVSGPTFWRVFWAGLLVESVAKFALIGEVFSRVFSRYDAIASLVKKVIRGVGIGLVLVATIAAAYAPVDNPRFSIISHAHILDQTIYLIECGILLFIFLLATYFKLSWDDASFGIALGLGTSACVHLATWAIIANGGMMEKRHLLDFLNMAAYHVCVLIWLYYLLVPHKIVIVSSVLPSQHDLAAWNQELERLLHQ